MPYPVAPINELRDQLDRARRTAVELEQRNSEAVRILRQTRFFWDPDVLAALRALEGSLD